MFADGQMTSKGRAGRFDDIRPCIGTNDCLHRILVEGFKFGCSVNPRTGYEYEALPEQVAVPKKVLGVGAGPAGMESAALLAERGHNVTLWEREIALGGQMRVAAQARENQSYHHFLSYQARRLQQLGVQICLQQEATADQVVAGGFEVVVVATGAAARRPDIPGVEHPLVLEGRDVMMGRVKPGKRVVVLAMEDHMQPLTIAGYLIDQGCDVEVIYPTPSIAPLIGKYSIGAPLAKLTAAGARLRVMERVVGIQPGELVTHNIYSGSESVITDFDNLVLACGGSAENSLYYALKGRVAELHLLGDAYAPRRISFATRQAYELAKLV
jgi:NADPH-dependent 2,4-dienoyl-CoA reductase/sulfur reductase-like enzyme